MADSEDKTSQPLKLSYAPAGSEMRWVTLGKFLSLEAQLLQANLQSQDIPVTLAMKTLLPSMCR